MHYTVTALERVDSTNRVARERALSGAPEGTVIVADRQEQGRGRFGRHFFSPPGTGLYMSIVLRPAIPPQQALYVTTAAAVAVAEAVEQLTGESARIKWVNDVYLRDKKVCGILTEGGMEGERLRFAVLGIGVNLAPPPGGFPPDIANKAGALFDTPRPIRDELVQAILTRFFAYYDRLADKPFLAEYRRRSLLTGKQVQLLSPDGVPGGTVTVRGIDDDFSLIVQDECGVRTLSSGDVSIKQEPC